MLYSPTAISVLPPPLDTDLDRSTCSMDSSPCRRSSVSKVEKGQGSDVRSDMREPEKMEPRSDGNLRRSKCRMFEKRPAA